MAKIKVKIGRNVLVWKKNKEDFSENNVANVQSQIKRHGKNIHWDDRKRDEEN